MPPFIFQLEGLLHHPYAVIRMCCLSQGSNITAEEVTAMQKRLEVVADPANADGAGPSSSAVAGPSAHCPGPSSSAMMGLPVDAAGPSSAAVGKAAAGLAGPSGSSSVGGRPPVGAAGASNWAGVGLVAGAAGPSSSSAPSRLTEASAAAVAHAAGGVGQGALGAAWSAAMLVAGNDVGKASDKDDLSMCPICLDACDPRTVTSCGHHFCSPCIHEIVQTVSTLPEHKQVTTRAVALEAVQ